MTVSLKDFVSQTLVDIVRGIESAKKEISADGAQAVISPPPANAGDDRTICIIDDEKGPRHIIGQVVHFDLATHAEESAGATGGFKVAVASVLKVGADAEGKTTDKTISRVQFSVPVVLSIPKRKGDWEPLPSSHTSG
ncbi:hypothetical protein [Paramagnetospirillum kuznetsovii]|uniref:hypothetical protein n=1 Tax=Paramagnetospirillum kuznetsovii TaxID=2053833 RepID=UPI0011BF8A3F|nr:hypothetical protein [Paramagnetospirillum kuznetsovii]